ncbi:MAG TPA: DUF484 family protein [Candidatus Accumulibacter phosphatis]|nr:MAG: hypothetical protein AW07_00539 [Candidatus Accumulibacter sp. SK-11]HAY27930.1 DUF484 domain-containing protein [Accumulibacter sp.]HCN67404.1 DUF484 domain-containing protein [Accumulibacter sp.]HRL76028.1 DUF484 family protein [Candidatus Accumulibacter phosphatis]HRQ95518.1 DUF484 family protein [Candidatus Accumulibacter phosphatis]
MRAEEVARYLQDNPQFFEQHAELVANMVVPHPHGGRAISITERQMLALRDKNRQLEGKMGELLQFGEENDALSAKMHRLAVGMIAAQSFQSVLHTLNLHLRDDFAIPHVALRLWRHPEGREELPEFAEVGEELQSFAETLALPFCGSTSGFETSSWFGEAASHVRSQGLIAMRNGGASLGMIALGSEDPERFYAGMGTIYLERLGEMAAAALARVLG